MLHDSRLVEGLPVDQIGDESRDIKLLPPTAKPWETSLPKWFGKRYSAYFGVRLEFHDFFYVFQNLHML